MYVCMLDSVAQCQLEILATATFVLLCVILVLLGNNALNFNQVKTLEHERG